MFDSGNLTLVYILGWSSTILRYHEVFFSGYKYLPRCAGMAAGAASLKKPHDIVILSFCFVVKDQANKY